MLVRCSLEDADLRIQGIPARCATAVSYHLARHWGERGFAVQPTEGRDWDTLAEDLENRFPPHVWHPRHWDLEEQGRSPRLEH